MLSDKIKELYPAHATPQFMEWLKEQIGVEMLRVLDNNYYQFIVFENIKDLANLIKEEI